MTQQQITQQSTTNKIKVKPTKQNTSKFIGTFNISIFYSIISDCELDNNAIATAHCKPSCPTNSNHSGGCSDSDDSSHQNISDPVYFNMAGHSHDSWSVENKEDHLDVVNNQVWSSACCN